MIKPFERNEILINVANALERKRLESLAEKCTVSQQLRPKYQTAKRQPIKVSTEEIMNLVRSGVEETAVMQKFNLSAKALHSLLDQLVARGCVGTIGN